MTKATIIHFIMSIIRVREHLIRFILNRKSEVNHNGVKLWFATPNYICNYRARSFSTKEPETLAWIDEFGNDEVFWDIGANVGIYSVYAAKARNSKVWAFEPSVFNLEFLARNINLNGMQEHIHILPIALNDKIGFNTMRHSSASWGGALSVFDKDYGQDGKKIANNISYITLGLTIDFAVSSLEVPLPDYVKMDVDGIEHLILSGGKQSISNAKEILIEINEDFEEQRKLCYEILQECGFELSSKGAYVNKDLKLSNQIWKKKPTSLPMV